MPPPLAADGLSAPAAASFSQANKLCFRATPAQATWLAEHIATAGRPISDVLREALDLYIAAHAVPGPGRSVVGDLPAAIVPGAVRPFAPPGLPLASLGRRAAARRLSGTCQFTDDHRNDRMSHHTPRVLNKRTDAAPHGAVYIGRPSKWGNPSTHLSGNTLARF